MLLIYLVLRTLNIKNLLSPLTSTPPFHQNFKIKLKLYFSSFSSFKLYPTLSYIKRKCPTFCNGLVKSHFPDGSCENHYGRLPKKLSSSNRKLHFSMTICDFNVTHFVTERKIGLKCRRIRFEGFFATEIY